MELASQSVSDLFLAKGDLSLSLEHVAPPETALDQTVQDITAQIIGLGEGKLDLYVPSQAIIEPISPAEESAPDLSAYEATEEALASHEVQSNHTSCPGMPDEIIAVNSSVSDSNPSEGSALKAAPSLEVCLGELPSNPDAPDETGIEGKEDTGVRKFIPPKKDRMDPLKMDMSKPTVIPLTCKFI